MTTHKEQRQHRYSWHTYTWPLTRNRDNIDIADRHIHDHSQGTETTSIFLTHIYMTTHKEQRQHRYSWETYTWPLTSNRDNIDIPDTYIHAHSEGTETTSIFLTDLHMTTHKEQRQHQYSWHIYTWPLTRNRDNIDIPDRHIHDHSQGAETTSIYLTHIYMTTHKEQRLHRYSWQTYTWTLTRNRDTTDIPDRHIHDHTTRNRDNIDIPDRHIHDHTTRNRDYIDIPDRHIHDHSQGTDNIDIPDTHIHDHSQGTETTSIFLTHIYMTTHKEQRQHRYSWHTYIHDHSQGTETTSIFLTHIYMTTQQGTETTSIFLTHIYMTTHKEQRHLRYSWHTYIHDHSQGIEITLIFLTDIYMTTHKEQRQHRYSWQTCTWPLTRNRDNIDIPDRQIHDHSQGAETTSIFLTDIYMTTHKEQKQHRYSWHTYTWPLTRNRDYIDIPDRHIHEHSQGTETTSIFLTDIYMTTHKEQRQHRYSWHTYTWPLLRNRDYIDIPDRHIHEHSQGTETPPIFLTDIYMTTHKEQRQHRYSWHIYTWPLTRNRDNIDIPDTHIYMTTHKEQRQHLYSWHIYTWPHNKEQRLHRYSWHIYTWPLTRNRDTTIFLTHISTWPLTGNRENIDIPDRHIHDHSQGTETTSIFLTHIYMTTHKEQRQHRYSWHIYTWPLTRNRDNIDIPDRHIHDHSQGTETTSIFLTHIYMTTHKEQRLHRYSWQIYTCPLTRNRDNIDIPDTHIHDHSQGTEATSIFLTHIYMTTHKEQRQHRYSWHTYTWPLTRNRDYIDIPDRHIHDHSQGTETTSIFLTHIYMTTHKEQRQHRYSWHTYTWPLTRNRDYIDIPDRHIHDHSQGTETTSIFLTHIYITTYKEQRQHRYSWQTYTWPRNKEQRQHRYSWQTYTWPLTRNREYIDIPDTHIHNHTTRNRHNIDIPDTHMHDHTTRNRDYIDIPDTYIHDHSQGTETTSIFLTDIYMTTHKEQKQHRYSWHTYTWPLTRNRDNIDIPDRHTWPLTRNRDYIDIPDTHIHDHSQGTETTSIFLTHIYMTTHKEQRQHRYSWHTYIHDHSQGTETTSIFLTHIYMTTQQGTETTSIFLTHIYMTTHKEQTTSIFLTHIYMTTHKEQRLHRYSWHTYTWPLTRNRDYIDIPDTHIHDHSQGTETTSIFLTHIYMTTHKEQGQHWYSWHTYIWPLTRNRDNIDIPDTHIHDHSTRNRDNIDIPDTHIHDHSQGTETTSIFLTDIYMTTHKEQRQHRYSWHIYTWPLTRNRDNIDIPDTHIYMTTHNEQRQHLYSWHVYTLPHNKEQRQHRYSWHTYTWPLTRNRDCIDIPDRHIHDHSQGTATTSIFLTYIYMTTHKEQRQHRYSWHTYTWPLTRNRDNIDIPDTHIHDHSQGTGTTLIFLTHIYMTTHKEQRQHWYSWHTYTWPLNKEQRQHRYSWHTYTWPLTRNRDNIDIPDRHIHDHSQGTETTSIFLTHIYMTTHKEQRQHRYSWHRYIHDHSQWTETTSIFLTRIYITTQQGTETTSIFLTHICMTTHKEHRQHWYSWQTYTWPLNKEQRQHRYSWQTYTWPLTRNRDYIDIPDTYIHDHSQGTETTSIFLTHIYMTTQQGTESTSMFLTDIFKTTHKEQRQHRYSWHTYTWPLTRNRDNIDIPDRHIHDHSQGTETTSMFLTDIFKTTHKEQRQHRYSWHTYTWPLTRNKDNIDIPDRHIHDHSQGTETTPIFLTHIYMTTHKEQRQHRYSWHIYMSSGRFSVEYYNKT